MVAGEIPNLFEFWDAGSLKVAAPIEIIFVCGGTTDKAKAHDLTRRDALFQICIAGELAKYHFVKAEDVDVLAPRGYYSDFLTFEMDIAQVCQLVLLFCESAGSFTELGAFCLESEIAQRMLVVIDDTKHNEDSFIRWGALSFLERLYTESSVCVLKTAEIGQAIGSRPDDIDKKAFGAALASALKIRVRMARENQTFDSSKSGHMIKLITGLIQDYGALKEDEIDAIMYCIGYPINAESFKRYAQCAEVLGWIKKDRRNSQTFYTATSAKEAIRFTYGNNKPIDRHRWRTDILQYWKHADQDRFESIQANRPA